MPVTWQMTFLGGGGGSDGRQQGGAVPVCPCLDRRAWESLNKQGPSERCRMGWGGGGVQGDRSVNHQWLRFILPPLSKNLQGRLCVPALQTGAGNLVNRKPTPAPSPFLFPPICPQNWAPRPPCCALLPSRSYFRPEWARCVPSYT